MSVEEVITDVDAEEVVDRKNLGVMLTVTALEPIPGKDKIEFLKTEGWIGVVQKGLHKIGDLVLVVRYDSIVPDLPMFAWMKDFKMRVKTKKFNTDAGPVYSQVIIIPAIEVHEYLMNKYETGASAFMEGDDMTDELGIKKYIPNQPGSSSAFGKMHRASDFPMQYVARTDETNVQSKTATLREFNDLAYYASVKCDGSSVTVLHPDDIPMVCSRNFQLKEEEGNAFWDVVKKYNLPEILAENKHLCIQGELCGPGIQGNKMGLKEKDLFIFNIIDITTRKRLDFIDMWNFCKEHKLKMVPIVEIGHGFNRSLDYLIKLATQHKYAGTENGIEGLVLRPQKATFSTILKNDLSVKIMNPEYK